MQDPSFLRPSNGMNMQNMRRTQTSSSLWEAMDSDVVKTPIRGSAKTNTVRAMADVIAMDSLAEYNIPSFILAVSF